MHVYEEGKAYEVEFVDSITGRTIAILILTSSDIMTVHANMLVPFHGFYSNLENPALEGVFWTIEPYMVGTAKVTIKTESDKNESRAEMYCYQTL